MKPKASLKSLKVKVRAIASRPGVSAQPDNSFSADFRASSDSRSAMLASTVSRELYPNTGRRPSGPCHNVAANPVQWRLDHDAVTMTPTERPARQEIC